MRTKMKKIGVAILALVMLAAGMTDNVIGVQAAERNSVVMTVEQDLIVTPGQTTHISVPIKATREYIAYPSMTISAAQDAPFTFSTPILTINNSSASAIGTGSSQTNLEFDVKVKDTALIKDYPITIAFTYNTFDMGTSSNIDVTANMNAVLKVQNEKTPAQLTVNNVTLGNSNVGSDTNLSLKVSNEGEITAKSTYMVIDYGGVIEERYTAKNIKIGDLTSGDSKNFTLPVSILSAAGTGKKALKCNFTYKTSDGTEKTSSYNIYVNLKSNISAPKLTLENATYKEGLKQSDKFTLTLNLENTGESSAKDIKATIDDASITQDGILKNYFTDGIEVEDLSKEDQTTVKIPLKVSKYATGGMKALKLNVSYKDKSDTSYTLTETVYVDVTAAPNPTGTPGIVIENVSQSPEQPSAGNKLALSFDVVNMGSVDISELKVYADGLTNSTFIPVKAEPYQYINKLKSGEKFRVTIPLVASKSIPEGLNNLTVKYKYIGGEDSVIIPVRNVRNDLSSSSMPKLIVSKYMPDTDKLQAGKTFKLTYDIYNTNSSVAAKNIAVTISQADNIFTVTQGSNSFFIAKINPGETVENTIELKVKSDAVTKAYPLKITLEYEYDGMPDPEKGQPGVTKVEELNLQAVENARPVVDNIQVYSFDGNVMVGSTATISFGFYNMGKSVLSNVTVTLEGDGFTKTDGSMYFVGNVQPGDSAPVEMEVTPNKEGNVPGKLKISYEDSNGDTVEFTKDFEGMVMPAGAMNMGGAPEGPSSEVMNQGMPPVGKKAILPTWAFVLAQLLIFILFVPITRKVIISVYKSKLRKKEEEQN